MTDIEDKGHEKKGFLTRLKRTLLPHGSTSSLIPRSHEAETTPSKSELSRAELDAEPGTVQSNYKYYALAGDFNGENPEGTDEKVLHSTPMGKLMRHTPSFHRKSSSFDKGSKTYDSSRLQKLTEGMNERQEVSSGPENTNYYEGVGPVRLGERRRRFSHGDSTPAAQPFQDANDNIEKFRHDGPGTLADGTTGKKNATQMRTDDQKDLVGMRKSGLNSGMGQGHDNEGPISPESSSYQKHGVNEESYARTGARPQSSHIPDQANPSTKKDGNSNGTLGQNPLSSDQNADSLQDKHLVNEESSNNQKSEKNRNVLFRSSTDEMQRSASKERKQSGIGTFLGAAKESARHMTGMRKSNSKDETSNSGLQESDNRMESSARGSGDGLISSSGADAAKNSHSLAAHDTRGGDARGLPSDNTRKQDLVEHGQNFESKGKNNDPDSRIRGPDFTAQVFTNASESDTDAPKHKENKTLYTGKLSPPPSGSGENYSGPIRSPANQLKNMDLEEDKELQIPSTLDPNAIPENEVKDPIQHSKEHVSSSTYASNANTSSAPQGNPSTANSKHSHKFLMVDAVLT